MHNILIEAMRKRLPVVTRVARWAALATLLATNVCSEVSVPCPEGPNCAHGTINSVVILGAPATMTVNQTASISASVNVTGNISTAVTWSSSNSSVFTLSASGNSAILSAVGPGTAVVVARAVADTSRGALVNITVTDGTHWAPIALPFVNGPAGEITGLWASSSSNVFAVSLDGDIAKFTGESWTIARRNAGHLRAIHGTSISDLWAVSDEGRIWHSDGFSWTSVAAPRSVPLLSMYALSSRDVFIAGDSGTVLRYDGRAWSEISGVPSTTRLVGVWASSPTDVYVVGGTSAYRWNGSTWTSLDTGLTGDSLFAISGSSANNILATGTRGTVLRWDGRSWTRLPQTLASTSLVKVQTLSATEAYILGQPGQLLRYDGSAFAPVTGFGRPRCAALYSLATSANYVGCVDGLILLRPTFFGETVTLSLRTGAFRAASSFGSGKGIIVGDYGAAFLINASRLTPILLRDVDDSIIYTGAWSRNATEAYVAANTGIYHYDGSELGHFADPRLQLGGHAMNAVWGSSSDNSFFADNVFVVGDGGAVIRFGGTGAGPLPAGTSVALRGVHGSGPTNVIVVGAAGTIVRYDGTKWSPISSGVSTELLGVWVADSNTAFVVGRSGTILRLNGQTSSKMTSTTTRDLYAVWGGGPNLVYAVGAAGTILRYDGSTWSTMPSGTTRDLLGIAGYGGAVFAVGDSSTVIVGTTASSSAQRIPDL